MKILVVDDSKISRAILLKRMQPEILETSTIIHGADGEEAVKLYKEHSPDIVFLDLTMPVMDGFEALELIMAYDDQALVYVITADVQTKSKEKVMASGATGMEPKPISEERLIEIFESMP